MHPDNDLRFQSQGHEAVFRAIETAARAGDPMPTCHELELVAGSAYWSQQGLKQAVTTGQITIERRPGKRRALVHGYAGRLPAVTDWRHRNHYTHAAMQTAKADT